MDKGPRTDGNPANALAWAKLAAILAAGAFGVSLYLHPSLAVGIVGSSTVLCTAVAVWYVEYRPGAGWRKRTGGLRWVAAGLSIALLAAGLWSLLSDSGDSRQDGPVPERVASPLAMDPDGSYSIGATGSADGVPGAVVVRIDADGRLDPTFGKEGVAFHRAGVGETDVDSILSGADGRVVIAGTEVPPDGRKTAFLGRLRADGSADRSFFSESEIAPGSEALVLRQAPQRLLLGVTSRLNAGGRLAGNSYLSANSYTVLGIDNRGALDRSFGKNARALGPIGCGPLVRIPCRPLRAMLLLPDDDVIGAATQISTIGRNGTLRPLSAGLRFNAPDEGWTTLAMDSDGRPLAGGVQAGGPHSELEFLIARLADGHTFDPGFGIDGVAKIELPADASELGGIAPLADGKILVAGRSATYQKDGLVVARLDAKGRLDPSFGSGGVATLHPLRVDRPLTRKASTAVAVDSDGRIVVAEILPPKPRTTTGGALAVARLLPDGRLDPSFAGDGVAAWSLDFRGIRVLRAHDRFLGGLFDDRAVRTGAFKYPRLGVLCEGTDAPSFICHRLDPGRQPSIEVRLAGAGKPKIVRRAGSCCGRSSAAWRSAVALTGGEEAWIRTPIGALNCAALSTELVCTNRSRHGFLIGASRVKSW